MTQGNDSSTDAEQTSRATFQPTSIPGVHVFEPIIHGDARGSFHEWFKAEAFIDATGYPFIPEQANMSVSAAGVVRGLHFADVPPGQAKLVTCAAGRVLDIIVDIRRGSPAFGRVLTVELEPATRRVVHLPVGVAHGFVSLADGSVLTYLTSTGYDPDIERAVSIRDPELGIDVEAILAGVGKPILSERDAAAPTIAEFERAGGALPDWDDCRALENELRDEWAMANEDAGEA
ncbi:dTDP-4-dehydrorhamnose 3,5-epimerase family protein [Corynebacterium hansenii]|uniref:dTDP-4-dehydrorhamnose 3,5-epimerase family protein n=1 Tax=Corynebacterium hansenii TaxID=394964 RepID=A0ABV7ZKY6_9CORY|nr:dTDP-4-dehydrorhamnose 3,5-epimerase family protein [Corynebacterium hansenii]WJY98947.1 dTDP-4-dehydrorhamnose 3,5-epimerase [Corynebacterium hansenii]